MVTGRRKEKPTSFIWNLKRWYARRCLFKTTKRTFFIEFINNIARSEWIFEAYTVVFVVKVIGSHTFAVPNTMRTFAILPAVNKGAFGMCSWQWDAETMLGQCSPIRHLAFFSSARTLRAYKPNWPLRFYLNLIKTLCSYITLVSHFIDRFVLRKTKRKM